MSMASFTEVSEKRFPVPNDNAVLMSHVERPVPYDPEGRLWAAALTDVSDALTQSGRLATPRSECETRRSQEQKLRYALDEIDLKIVTLQIQRHRLEREIAEMGCE